MPVAQLRHAVSEEARQTQLEVKKVLAALFTVIVRALRTKAKCVTPKVAVFTMKKEPRAEGKTNSRSAKK